MLKFKNMTQFVAGSILSVGQDVDNKNNAIVPEPSIVALLSGKPRKCALFVVS